MRYNNKLYRSVPLVLVALLREYAYSADLPWLPNFKKKKKKKFFFFLDFFFIFPNGCLLVNYLFVLPKHYYSLLE